jgi:hypothetical protein
VTVSRFCRSRWWQRGKHRTHPKCDGWWESPNMVGACDCDCHALSSEQMAALVERYERNPMQVPW